LRRNISTSAIDSSDINDVANNINIWQRLTDECRNIVKAELINVLIGVTAGTKHLTHKVCSLAVEIQGAMQEHQNEAIWTELLGLVNQFI
jgi:hypothetical protein